MGYGSGFRSQIRQKKERTAEGGRDVEERKFFYTAEDIAIDLSVSEGEAAELVKKLQKELKEAGKMVIRGKIPAAWYERQKEGGFLETGQQAERIPLTERRLLGIKDFREYAGGISDGRARKLAKEIGAEVHIGDRFLVDRMRFDEWCMEQHRLSL